MLTKTKLRALQPGQWARVRVPDYDCWRTNCNIRPGDEVDVCVMPTYEPRWDYPRCWQWFYRCAYRLPGSEHVRKQRRDDDCQLFTGESQIAAA